MKHQLQLGIESGIVSNEAVKEIEAVKQIRMLITDLTRTFQTLDRVDTKEKRACANDLNFARLLATRRCNLMVTIATLEDHIRSLQNMQSHYAANSTLPRPRSVRPH